jgi:putative transposase
MLWNCPALCISILCERGWWPDRSTTRGRAIEATIGQCTTPAWLKTDFILGSFGRKAPDAKNRYRRCVEDLLDSEYESPLNAMVASTVLGRWSAFVREVSERHLGEKRSERSMPAVKALVLRPSMDEIIMKTKAELGDRAELLRNVSLYCCQKYSGAKLKDIGERFGISDAAVSQASRRVAFKAETDQHLKEMLDRVETLLRDVTS